MARIRDYKAEERRRNELAKARGFKSRAQQRHRIETGRAPAIAPKLIRSERTRKAQAAYRAKPKPPSPPLSLYEREVARVEAQSSRADKCRDYSAAHAHRTIAKFDYDANIKDQGIRGVTRKQYEDAYYAAFVDSPGRYGAVRKSGGSEELRHYFVDITHYYSPDEYEARYGQSNPVHRR